VAGRSFNGVAVLGFDSAPRGGETKGWDRERKSRQHRSSGGAEVALSTMTVG
jgi:hypothetical protein